MTVVEIAPLVKTIEVRRSAEDAFRLFAEDISAWWPRQHTRARSAAGEQTVRIDFEPKIGGRIYETLNTGVERDWGEVLALEPGRQLLFSFTMGRTRAEAGEVEVRFDPIKAGACRVTLTHTHWERYGEEAARMRDGFDTGWVDVFIGGYGVFADKL